MPASEAQTDPRSVIRVSSGAEDNVTLDPDRATSTNDVGVVAEIFNGLVRFAPGSAHPKSLEADLAESREVSKDSTVWTFHLRHGVKFHGDWGELTSADVVYSLQRAANPKRSSFAANFAIVDKVESTDPYTVRITLKYPDATFLGRVSNYHGGNIVSMKATEKYNTANSSAIIQSVPSPPSTSISRSNTCNWLRTISISAASRSSQELPTDDPVGQ